MAYKDEDLSLSFMLWVRANLRPLHHINMGVLRNKSGLGFSLTQSIKERERVVFIPYKPSLINQTACIVLHVVESQTNILGFNAGRNWITPRNIIGIGYVLYKIRKLDFQASQEAKKGGNNRDKLFSLKKESQVSWVHCVLSVGK